MRRDAAARICGVTPATWARWMKTGRVPAPCMQRPRKGAVGSAIVLWSVEDLRAWVGMGMPDRKEFEARRGRSGSGAGAVGRGRDQR